MSNSGFFKGYRDLTNHPAVLSSPHSYRWVLITILDRMAFEPQSFDDHGVKVSILPGQIYFTYELLAEWADVDLNTAKRSVKKFLNSGIFSHQVNRKNNKNGKQEKTLLTVSWNNNQFYKDYLNSISSDPKKCEKRQEIILCDPTSDPKSDPTSDPNFSQGKTGSSDPKNDPNLDSEVIRKQEQYRELKKQQPQTPSSVVVVFSCLENFVCDGLTQKEKMRITKNYYEKEKVVIDAVDVVSDVNFVPQDTLLKSLRAAIKGEWKPKKNCSSAIEKNLLLAQTLEKYKHPYYQFIALKDALEIVKGGNSVPSIIIYQMTEERFIQEVEKQGRVNISEIFNKKGIA